MNSVRLSVPWVMLAVFAITLMLGLYFTFAAVQGDYGLFRRAEILNDARKLEAELTMLQNEVDKMRNLDYHPGHLQFNLGVFFYRFTSYRFNVLFFGLGNNSETSFNLALHELDLLIVTRATGIAMIILLIIFELGKLFTNLL